MSYIRFTAQQFTEDQLVAVATAVATFCENKIVEDEDSDCTYYETKLGQSYEFDLVEDLDERVVEAIIDSLGTHIEDFTVEATGQ